MKSRSLKSRVLAFLLVVCMVVGLTPVYAVSVGTSVATLQVDGTNNSDVHVTFTPTENGHYFLVNQPPLPTLSACGDHGAVPTSFDFDDDEGWGYVYELTAGQTYCFRAETTNAYTVNVKKVSVAQSFDIPATLTGYAGQTIALPIDFNDALSTEVACDNPSVVELRGGNAHSEDLKLLAPGTATITVTPHTGDPAQTCVVTVVDPIFVTIQANGVEFFVNVTSGETDWENGSSTGSMTTRFMPGKTLNDVGVTVSHDSADAPHLTGWQINGKTIVNTADLHTYVFTEDTVIEPLWTPSKYTSLRWLTIHGNGGTFERTTQDSEKIETRQMGYDSYPTEGALATLSHTGIMNLTDPVCAGKEFEGWVAYYHGPTDTGFTNPVDGTLLTTAQVLAYTNQGVGYTDFIAKWKGEAIDPNNCPIDGTNTQISVIQKHWAVDPTHNLAISSNNSSNFTLHYANASPATHSGYYGEDQRNAALTTLSAMGVTDIELDTSTQFAYWSVYTPVFNSNNEVTYWIFDEELPNKNDILTYPLGNGVMFVAEWDLGMGGNPSGPSGYSVDFVTNGIEIQITSPDENGNIVTYNVNGSASRMVQPGQTLAQADISLANDPQHDPYFLGWHYYLPDANGNWVLRTDPIGDPIVLTHNELNNNYTVDCAVRFEAQWQPGYTGNPGGNTLPTNLIINSNNGTDFTLHTNDGSETFSCQFEGYADPALGNTLADLGLISIDLDTSTPFACWVVYRPVFDNDGNIIDWEKELDEYGNDRILPNKDLILTWPINNGVMFVADWIAGGNQGGNQGGHRVEIHSSGVPYMHSVPDENGNIVSGEIGDAFGTTIASGTTLSDAGISVWQYAHNDPYFEGWHVYHQDSDGYWVEDKDSDGNFIVLDTASMLNTPITEDVRFEASWQRYRVIFEDVDGGTFDQVDVDNGTVYSDDTSKIAWSVSYMHSLDALITITDIKNGSETFYGWDVYEEVDDPNDPSCSIMNFMGGPISTEDALSLPITYNVVFQANWTGGNQGSGTPGTPAPYSAGLAISGNGGTFDIVRTNSQGKTEIWEDAEHTREDMDVFIGDTLADFGITDLTDLKFWDGQREFVGWQVYGVYTVTDQWGSYEEYGPLSDKIYTTKEILAYPAEKTFIEFVAVWAGDDADYFTDVIFDALGGTFLVTAFDYTEEGPVVLGSIPMDYLWVEDCMENGQSIKEQFDSSFYPISDPVRTGYTFEGWLAFYEDQYLHEMSDKLYTTEQVVNLPIPEENVQYLAKWKEIPMDEYRFGDPYFPYDGTYVQHYTVANGGDLEISVNYSGGKDTYSMPFLSHQGQSSMSFLEHTKDISGLEFEFDLTDKTNFEGWTTYQAERLFIIHLLEGDKLNLPANNYTAFKIDTEEYEDENGDPINLEIYMVLKNAKIYSTTMTPKEVLQLKGDTFYATVAQWHEASATLANVKAATCTAEGYTGDKVCAKCGEILEKGQTIPKAAHEISATLANVKAATCAAEGYTGDKVCAKCGEVLVKGEAIAKLAHTPSANLANVKSATHTEEGYTGDVVCADCGAVIKTGKVIDKVKETVATPVVKEESKAAVDSQIQDVVAVISGEKTEETKIVLSEGTEKAIEEAVTKGDVVGADIVIEPISEENLSAEELASFKKEAAAIENTATAELGDTATVAEFIDISVIVKNRTTGEELGNITELAKPVTIEILVPAALQAENREYYIVHFHDGQATLIKGDYKDGVLTISADKFSTYALVYADVPETPDPIVPATGDQSHLVFFTTMLLLSAAGIYLASRKLRRA